jgi:serpin B
MKPFRLLLCAIALVGFIPRSHGADADLAAHATNQLGIDLYRQLAAGDENLCLSPYSIQSALAMTFAGADGTTRTEMAGVLHYGNDGDAIHASFAALGISLDRATKGLITLITANRLYGQTGYNFRDSFEKQLKQFYGASFEPMDFRRNGENARRQINQWIAGQTRKRIREVIPAGGLPKNTGLVLVNALYLKAWWESAFYETATEPGPFHVRGGPAVETAMMNHETQYGYAKRDGFTAISLPYEKKGLQLLVLFPDDVNGLHALEAKLSDDVLAQCARLEPHDVDLSMPKFKFEPPTIPLGEKLQELGMKTAFDRPPDSANFDRIAPRRPDNYLAISEIFHKTFIAVDENGTEAAAASVVRMGVRSWEDKPPPLEVKVDRPFFYAIQHVSSGACLFVGRVTDPR